MEREDLKKDILEILENTKSTIDGSAVGEEELSTLTQKIEALETCENLHDFAMDVDLYCNMVLKAYKELLYFKPDRKSPPIKYLQTNNIVLRKITDDKWESGSKNVVLERSGVNWIANFKDEAISTELSNTVTKLQDLPNLHWMDYKFKHQYLNAIAPCYVLVTINDEDHFPTVLRWRWTDRVHGYSNKYDDYYRYEKFLEKYKLPDNDKAKKRFIKEGLYGDNKNALLNIPVYKANELPVQEILMCSKGWCTRVFTEDKDNEGNVFEDSYTLENTNLFAETGWTCEHPRNKEVKLRVYPAT